MNRLCPDCRNARDRWINHSGHLLHPAGIRFASHASSDDTVAGVARKRQARVDDYYALVRRQLALIDEICARKHQLAPGIEPLRAAEGDTFDLFGEAA